MSLLLLLNKNIPLAETLSDDFTIDRKASLWSGSYGNTSVANGVATTVADPSVNTTSNFYTSITNGKTFSLKNSFIAVKVTLPAATAGSFTHLVAYNPADTTNNVAVEWENTTLRAGSRSTNTFSAPTTSSVTANTTVMFGIAEGTGRVRFTATAGVANTLYYYFSRDAGTTWTALGTSSSPSWINNVAIAFGTRRTVSGTTTATFDDFNYFPPLHTLTDDFSGTSLSTAKWPGQYGSTQIVNGELELRPTATDLYPSVHTVASSTGSSYKYLFKNSYFKWTWWLSSTLPNAHVQLATESNATYLSAFYTGGSVSIACYVNNTDVTPNVSVPITTDVYEYFAFAEGYGADHFGVKGTPGVTYVLYSANGTLWSVKSSFATPDRFLKPIQVSLSAGNAEGGFAAWDNINLPANTPGQILNIGPGTGKNNFDLYYAPANGTSVIRRTQEEIANGFADASHFYGLSDGFTAFRSRADGSGTFAGPGAFASTELRELNPDGTNASFDALTGEHIIQGRSRIPVVPSNDPEVAIVRLFNSDGEKVVIRSRMNTASSEFLAVYINNVVHATSLQNPFSRTAEFDWKIRIINGTLEIYYNDMVTPVITSTALTAPATANSWFWTVGAANYFNEVTSGADGFTPNATDWAEVRHKNLSLTHGSGAVAPAYSASVPLTGSGTLTASGVPTATRSVSFTGSGTLTASGVPTATRSVSFTGSGTLAGGVALHQFSDNFDSGSLNPLLTDNYGQYSIVNGVLNITATNDGGVNRYPSVGTARGSQSIINSSVFVKVTLPNDTTQYRTVSLLLPGPTLFSDQIAATWYADAQQLWFGVYKGYVATGFGGESNIAALPGSTVWIAIAEGTGANKFGLTGTAGSIYFFTSVDGITWTHRHTGVTPVWAGQTSFRVEAANDNGTGSITALFDNVNIVPITVAKEIYVRPPSSIARSNTTTSITIKTPAAAQVGDVLLYAYSTPDLVASQSTTPSEFTLLSSGSSGTYGHTRLAYKTVAAEDIDRTWVFADPVISDTRDSIISLTAIAGVDPSSPLGMVEAISVAGASSINPAFPTKTPTSGNSLALYFGSFWHELLPVTASSYSSALTHVATLHTTGAYKAGQFIGTEILPTANAISSVRSLTLDYVSNTMMTTAIFDPVMVPQGTPGTKYRYYNTATTKAAIDSATSIAEINTALQTMGNAYGIKKFHVTPETTYIDRHWDTPNFSNPKLKPAIKTVVDALAMYPPEYISLFGMPELAFASNIVNDLSSAGIGGFSHYASLWIDVEEYHDRAVEYSVEYILHHEITHIQTNTFAERYQALRAQWEALNPAGFTYNADFQNLSYAGEWPNGFVSAYATHSFGEDFAETSAYLFDLESQDALAERVASDSIIASKIAIVKDWYAKRSNNVISGDAYYAAIHEAPGKILGIGTGDNENYFKVQIAPTNGAAIETHSLAEIEKGYYDPEHFYGKDGWAVFRPRANGATTSGSAYARDELREVDQAGVDFKFNALTSEHILQGRTKITYVPANDPDVVIAQLHNGDTDRISIRTQMFANGTVVLGVRINGSLHATRFQNPFVLGSEFDWKIRLINGTAEIYFNNMVTPLITSTDLVQTTHPDGWYWKVGAYNQFNTTETGATGLTVAATEYSEVHHKNLDVVHVPNATVARNFTGSGTLKGVPTFSHFKDDFSSGSLDPAHWEEPYGDVSVYNGELIVFAMPGIVELSQAPTKRFSLLDSSVFFKFRTPNTMDGVQNTQFELMNDTGTSPSGGVAASYRIGGTWNGESATLTFGIRQNWAYTSGPTSIPLSGDQTIWVAFAEGLGASKYGITGVSGTTYIFTSADAVTWTQEFSGPTPFWVRDTHLQLQQSTNDSGWDSASAVFDNFNTVPATAYSTTATLSGSGTLTAAGAPTFSGSVALTGSGALSTTSIAHVPRSVALTGSGTLSATATGMSHSRSAAFSGSGAMGTQTSLSGTTSAPLTGSGTLTATAVTVGRTGSASLNGSGTLTGAATQVTASTSAALTGSGTLTSTRVASTTASVSLSGSGTLTVSGVSNVTRAVALTGSGTFSPTQTNVSQTSSATFSGSGALGFQTTVTGSASASLTGSGTLSATGAIQSTSVSVSRDGSGTLSSTRIANTTGSATLSGSGTLSATGTSSVTGAASFAGSGALTGAQAVPNVTRSVALSGSGTLTPTATGVSQTATATFSGSGALGTQTAVHGQTSVFTTGTGTLEATGLAQSFATEVALTGSGVLSSTRVAGTSASVGLTGSGTLAATGTPAPAASAGLSGSGTLTSSATSSIQRSVALSGSGDLAGTATGMAHSRSAALSGSGSLGVQTALSGQASAPLSGSGTLEATGVVRSLSGSASLTGSGTLSSTRTVATSTSSALTGSGNLTTVRSVNVPVNTALSGSGTLTTTVGVVSRTQSASFTGSGTLSAVASAVHHTATVEFTGSGVLETTTGAVSVVQDAEFSGEGSIGTFTRPHGITTTNIYGTGDLTVTADAVTATGAVHFESSGSLSASQNAVGHTANAGLSGSGTLTSTRVAGATGSVALSGTGSLSTQVAPRVVSSTSTTGSGTLGLSANAVALSGTVSLTGSGNLDSEATGMGHASATSLTGAGNLSVETTTAGAVNSSLDGSGDLDVAVGTVGRTQAAELSGSGDLDANATSVVASRAVSLSGSGALAGLATPNVVTETGFTGSGTLSATADTVSRTASANFEGSSALSPAVSTISSGGSVFLTGTGSLNGLAVGMGHASDAAFEGDGTLGYQTALSGADNVAITGTGTLSPAVRAQILYSAGLSGTGSLSSSTQISASTEGEFSSDGELSVTRVPSVAVEVNTAGSGNLSAEFNTGTVQTVGLSGTGTLSSIATPTTSEDVDLAGTGTLTVEATFVSQSEAVELTGFGQLAPVTSTSGGASVSITGTGDLSAESGEISASAEAVFAGSGELTVVTAITSSGVAELTGSGTLTGITQSTTANSAFLTGDGSLDVSGAASTSDEVVLTGTGTLGVQGAAESATEADFAGSGALSVTASKVSAQGTASFDGQGGLGVGTQSSRSDVVFATGTGTLSVETETSIKRTGFFSGSGVLSAVSKVSTVASAVFSGLGRLTASIRSDSSETAALAGIGGLTATTKAKPTQVVYLGGEGDLSEETKLSVRALAILNGEGLLTSESELSAKQTVVFAGEGQLVIEDKGYRVDLVLFEGNGTLTAVTRYVPPFDPDPNVTDEVEGTLLPPEYRGRLGKSPYKIVIQRSGINGVILDTNYERFNGKLIDSHIWSFDILERE